MTQSGRVLLESVELELVGADGQAVAHDRLHPPLAEGAARLLVGENVLQRNDFLGHAGHARLRGVDHREPLVELVEVGAGRLRMAFEPGAEPRADVVEPLRPSPASMSACREPSHSLIEPRRPLSSAFDCASAAKRASSSRCRSSAASRLAPARRVRAQQRDDQREQQQRDRAERAAERLAEGDGIAVEDEQNVGFMASSLADSPPTNRTKEEQV